MKCFEIKSREMKLDDERLYEILGHGMRSHLYEIT